MSNEMHQLAIRIVSEGGSLTITPMGILQHFLPGASALPNGRVFAGHPPGRADVTVYVNVEALAGMLMECRDKKINPISGCYLIPSNHPDKPASHKVKYEIGVQRARKIPGFLGMNMGLQVMRNKQVVDTSGETALPGDVIVGAWAELYVAGLPRPLRKEIPASIKGTSDAWRKHEGFMYLKTAVDRLLRMNFPSLYADEATAITPLSTVQPGDEKDNPDDIILEATAPSQFEMPPPPPFEFQPDTAYTGEIAKLTPRETKDVNGQKKNVPGQIGLRTEHGDLLAFFWERPESLKQVENWGPLIGTPGNLVFSVKEDKTGTRFRYVKEFAFLVATPEQEEEAAA